MQKSRFSDLDDDRRLSGCVSVLLGLMAGVLSVPLCALLCMQVEWRLWPGEWPAPYYARARSAELLITLIVDGVIAVLLRRKPIFTVPFVLGTLAACAFGVFLVYIGLDGSRYFP